MDDRTPNSPGAWEIALGVGLVAVLVAGGIVGLAVGVGHPSSPHRSASRSDGLIAFVPTTSSPPPIPARSALRRVLGSLNTGRVRSDIVWARIGGPPHWKDATAVGRRIEAQAARAAVPSLHVRVKIPRRAGGNAIEPLWQADLLTGALVELAGPHQALQSDVGTIDVSAQAPDGKVFPDLGGGMGGIARGQHFAGADYSDAQVRNDIEQRASSLGLRVDSVAVFRALGAAPAVVLTAPHIRSTAENLGTVEERLFGEGSTPRYEGFFLEIRGAHGTPHVWRSVSYLTGAGSLWIDRSVGGCGGSCG